MKYVLHPVFPYISTHRLSYPSVVKEINKINQAELDLGLSGASWHDEYKDSAYIFIGGLHFDLTEGDVITIFSQ
jgi:RNA-binding motif X-linked protein 2